MIQPSIGLNGCCQSIFLIENTSCWQIIMLNWCQPKNTSVALKIMNFHSKLWIFTQHHIFHLILHQGNVNDNIDKQLSISISSQYLGFIPQKPSFMFKSRICWQAQTQWRCLLQNPVACPCQFQQLDQIIFLQDARGTWAPCWTLFPIPVQKSCFMKKYLWNELFFANHILLCSFCLTCKLLFPNYYGPWYFFQESRITHGQKTATSMFLRCAENHLKILRQRLNLVNCSELNYFGVAQFWDMKNHL